MLAAALSSLLAVSALALDPAPAYGVLLVAPDGAASRRETAALIASLGREVPWEAVHSVEDQAELRVALNRLESKRPAKIVVMPLTLSSSSGEAEAVRGHLGLRDAPKPACRAGAESCPPPLRPSVPVAAVPGMEDHPFIGRILTERLRLASREPRRETVILVAQAPADGRGRKALERAMRSAGHILRRETGCRAVRTSVLKLDGTAMDRARSISNLRTLVGRAGSEGKAIVLPFVLAWDHGPSLAAALEGLPCVVSSQTLLPHPLIVSWVREAASMGSRSGDMRRFTRADPRRVEGLKALLRGGKATAADPGVCSDAPEGPAASQPCAAP
ncbi:MAG: hypothetical protein HY924_00925 [Elusimicrobia bacterium]|nr:hypothetical protein [Elusimicrobiota bacterium]